MKKGQTKITLQQPEENETIEQNVSTLKELTTKKRKRSDSNGAEIKPKKVSKKNKRDVDNATVEVEDVKSLKNIGDEDDEQTSVLEADKYPLKSFRLTEKTINKLNKRGISSLFEIQALTFDHILDGKDLIGRARTGMGKTLAFVLPLIEKLTANPLPRDSKKIRVIVLAPVRELAKQISEEFDSVTDLSVACFYGGVPVPDHIRKIKQGVDIVVATPGRVNDLLERGVLSLAEVEYVVLDEADKMLEMGFKEEIEKILSAIGSNEASEGKKKHRQTVLFSATVPPWVKEISTKYMAHDKVIVDMVESEGQKASIDVRHIAVPCQRTTQRAIILDLISMYAGSSGRTIVFCNTKAECNNFMSSDDFTMECSVIHGDIPQQQREVMLQSFRDGKVKVLIATDVAARGLDMVVDLVIQDQPPVRKSGIIDVDTYVHRSGRTGRAGKKGVCVTLYNGFQKTSLKKIESAVGNKFEWASAPNQDDVLKIAAINAIEQAKNVDQDVLPYYQEAVNKFLTQYKPQEAVGILLALVTGYLKPPRHRSLLASHYDFVTFQFVSLNEIQSLRYVFGVMKKYLEEAVVESIKSLTLSKDHHTAVFDIPLKHFNEFKSLAEINTNFKVCEQLPLLEDKYSNNEGGYGNFGRGNRSGGGGRNGNGYGRNNGFGGRNNGFGGRGNGFGGRGRSNGANSYGGENNFDNGNSFSGRGGYGGNSRGGGSNGYNGGNRGNSNGSGGGFNRNNSFSNRGAGNGNGSSFENKKIRF